MVEATENKISVLWDLSEQRDIIYVEKIEWLKEKPVYEFVKRVFDVVASLIALFVFLIPMILLAVLIRMDSKGNPIYVQTRLGKDQLPFKIYKLRTMTIDAENGGAQWAQDDDPRVTKIGRILRKTKMDELPQLINILKGEMSIVGPRPERPEFYEVFDTYIEGFRQRMLVKPGLTGHAQVNGGYFLAPEEKIIYDIEYIKNRSIKMDLWCVLKTVQVVFLQNGAK